MQPFFQFMVDYWWLAPLAGAGLVVYRFAGWRGLLAIISFGVAGGLWTEGRRHERAKVAEAAERRRREALEDRSRIDAEVSKLSPDDRRKRLAPWMRDN